METKKRLKKLKTKEKQSLPTGMKKISQMMFLGR